MAEPDSPLLPLVPPSSPSTSELFPAAGDIPPQAQQEKEPRQATHVDCCAVDALHHDGLSAACEAAPVLRQPATPVRAATMPYGGFGGEKVHHRCQQPTSGATSTFPCNRSPTDSPVLPMPSFEAIAVDTDPDTDRSSSVATTSEARGGASPAFPPRPSRSSSASPSPELKLQALHLRSCNDSLASNGTNVQRGIRFCGHPPSVSGSDVLARSVFTSAAAASGECDGFSHVAAEPAHRDDIPAQAVASSALGGLVLQLDSARFAPRVPLFPTLYQPAEGHGPPPALDSTLPFDPAAEQRPCDHNHGHTCTAPPSPRGVATVPEAQQGGDSWPHRHQQQQLQTPPVAKKERFGDLVVSPLSASIVALVVPSPAQLALLHREGLQDGESSPSPARRPRTPAALPAALGGWMEAALATTLALSRGATPQATEAPQQPQEAPAAVRWSERHGDYVLREATPADAEAIRRLTRNMDMTNATSFVWPLDDLRHRIADRNPLTVVAVYDPLVAEGEGGAMDPSVAVSEWFVRGTPQPSAGALVVGVAGIDSHGMDKPFSVLSTGVPGPSPSTSPAAMSFASSIPPSPESAAFRLTPQQGALLPSALCATSTATRFSCDHQRHDGGSPSSHAIAALRTAGVMPTVSPKSPALARKQPSHSPKKAARKLKAPNILQRTLPTAGTTFDLPQAWCNCRGLLVHPCHQNKSLGGLLHAARLHRLARIAPDVPVVLSARGVDFSAAEAVLGPMIEAAVARGDTHLPPLPKDKVFQFTYPTSQGVGHLAHGKEKQLRWSFVGVDKSDGGPVWCTSVGVAEVSALYTAQAAERASKLAPAKPPAVVVAGPTRATILLPRGDAALVEATDVSG